MILFIALAVLFVALANRANDNFKGVATLHGTGNLPYRQALAWATVTTLGRCEARGEGRGPRLGGRHRRLHRREEGRLRPGHRYRHRLEALP